MATRTPVNSNHICLDERGVAYVGDSRLKVIHVVMDKLAHGSTPEEYVEQHPDVITVAEAYAAMAYYYDHKAEFDEQIEAEHQEYLALRAQAGESPTLKKARTLGLRP